MLYIRINENFKAVEAIEHEEFFARFKGNPMGKVWAWDPGSSAFRSGWIDKHDIKSLAMAEGLARDLTEASKGRTFVGTDAGDHVSPRFGVCEVPRIGDKVSYSFNGDTYPCGEVTKISGSLRRIVATEYGANGNREHVFYRKGQTGGWKKNGTWWLVAGHIEERNPHL